MIDTAVFKYKKMTDIGFGELLSRINVHSTKKKIHRLSMMIVGVQVCFCFNDLIEIYLCENNLWLGWELCLFIKHNFFRNFQFQWNFLLK